MLASFFTSYQRDLVSRALERNRTYLAQVANIMFAISADNQPGVAGVNTAGGLPTDIANTSAVSQVQSPIGTLVEADADAAQVAYSEKQVTSATANTLTYTPAVWVVNEHFNRWVVITAGKGQGQKRYIASNTANILTTTQAWQTIPDATSKFKIVYALLEAETDLGVVASYPFTKSEEGYLVKLDATGTPYIDLANPLVAKFDVGIPIPPHHLVIDGQVRFSSDTEEVLPFTIQGYKARFQPRAFYSGYIMNGQLFINGTDDDWQDVASIELRYQPIAPGFTALTDYFLLPDTAYSALVAGGALQAALRVNGLDGVPKIDISSLADRADKAEQTYLRGISIGKRRAGFIKEG